MCAVSMMGDYYQERIKERYPQILPNWTLPQVTKEEFDALKQDVLEMKELLRRAKIYDAENSQPDCQQEEKLALLRQIAKMVGVELEI